MRNVPRPALLAVAAVAALSLVAYASVTLSRRPSGDRSITADTVIDGDLTIARGEATVLRGGAKLTVRGRLDVSGTLTCENGELIVEVERALTVSGSIT